MAADSPAGDHVDPEIRRRPRRRPRPVAGVALLLLGLGAVLLAGALDVPAEAKVVGGNLPVNAGATDPADISAHNSPTLVRNPADGTNLAIANRIDSPQFSCAFHVSVDGGANWSQTPLPVPEGEEPKCYAPDTAFGSDGVLHLVYVTLRGAGNVPNAVWAVSSRDGGRSLSLPVRVAPLAPLAFQVRLVGDPTDPRRLYVVWLQAAATATLGFPETGYPIQFARSDDGGATWQGPERVSQPSRRRAVAPSIVAGPRGELYVAYLDLGDDRLDYNGGHEGKGGPPYGDTWTLVLARSSDRGATWSESVVDQRLVPTERFVVFLPPFPSVAVDPRNGRVYVGFHDGRDGDADVRVWASGDSGISFGPPRRVNDTPRRDGSSQYLPKLAVAADGRLDVLYYDRRADPENVRNDVALQSSFDDGASFAPMTRLSDRPFDSRIGFGAERDMPDLGSRLGLVSTRAGTYAVWADTRAGTPVSGKQDLVRAVVEVSRPDRRPPAALLGVRLVGGAVALAGLAVLASSFRRGGVPGERKLERSPD